MLLCQSDSLLQGKYSLFPAGKISKPREYIVGCILVHKKLVAQISGTTNLIAMMYEDRCQNATNILRDSIGTNTDERHREI